MFYLHRDDVWLVVVIVAVWVAMLLGRDWL